MLMLVLQVVLGIILLIRIGGVLSKKLKDGKKTYIKFKICVLSCVELVLLLNYHKSIISQLLCIISLLYIAYFILEAFWRFLAERKERYVSRKEYVIFVITGTVCLAAYVLYAIICVNIIFFDNLII